MTDTSHQCGSFIYNQSMHKPETKLNKTIVFKSLIYILNFESI